MSFIFSPKTAPIEPPMNLNSLTATATGSSNISPCPHDLSVLVLFVVAEVGLDSLKRDLHMGSLRSRGPGERIMGEPALDFLRNSVVCVLPFFHLSALLNPVHKVVVQVPHIGLL